jgi:hypothetical protein
MTTATANSNSTTKENVNNSKLQTTETRKCTKCKSTIPASSTNTTCEACLLRQRMYMLLTTNNYSLNTQQAQEYTQQQEHFLSLTGAYYKPRTEPKFNSSSISTTQTLIRTIVTNVSTGTTFIKSSTDVVILSITSSGNIDIYTPDLFTIDNIPVTELLHAYKNYNLIKEAIQ